MSMPASFSVRAVAILVASGALGQARAAEDIESLASRVQVIEDREAISPLIMA